MAMRCARKRFHDHRSAYMKCILLQTRDGRADLTNFEMELHDTRLYGAEGCDLDIVWCGIMKLF